MFHALFYFLSTEKDRAKIFKKKLCSHLSGMYRLSLIGAENYLDLAPTVTGNSKNRTFGFAVTGLQELNSRCLGLQYLRRAFPFLLIEEQKYGNPLDILVLSGPRL